MKVIKENVLRECRLSSGFFVREEQTFFFNTHTIGKIQFPALKIVIQAFKIKPSGLFSPQTSTT